jgi:hypothetical protein
MVQRDHVRAQELHEEGLPLAREANDGIAMAFSVCLGAAAALARGDHRQVRALCEEGLRLSRQIEYKHALVLTLQVPAASAQAQGKPVRSARLWEAAEALREDIGAAFSPVESHFYGPYIEAARAQLDEETWEAAWAEGQAMTPGTPSQKKSLLRRRPCRSNRRPTNRPAGSPDVRRRLRAWSREG